MKKPLPGEPGHLIREVIARCEQLNIPAQAILELTYRCNLGCVHCYLDNPVQHELSTAEWKQAIDVLKAAGTMYILFTGGEPLVRDDFLELFTYARKTGFHVGLNTNGTLLTPEIAAHIAASKPYGVHVSLYGATAATHDEITGVPGSFEKTIEGILLLVAQGLTPQVENIIMKSNLHEVEKVRELVVTLGGKPVSGIDIAPSKTGRDYPLKYVPSDDEIYKSGWEPDISFTEPCLVPNTCKAGKAVTAVSPSGGVSPCIMMPLELGNIIRDDFPRFWHEEPSRELRELRQIQPEDLEDCRGCADIDYCRRCAGIAYLETGRLTAKSPSACRFAAIRHRICVAA